MEDAVCPLDFRYGRPAMKALLGHESRLANMLKVEAALANAQSKLGTVPKEAAKEIARKADLRHVRTARVKEIEDQIRHDTMAVVKALAEKCGGDAGRYVHLGATSYDIIDTAMALEIKKAIKLVREDLRAQLYTLAGLSIKHKGTVMVGRTHGQFALPITLGLKFAVFTSEVLRHLERIDQSLPRISVGKMAGAVGTSAGFGRNAGRIRDLMSKDLGIEFEEATTQIVQRDRYVELVSLLCNIATTQERLATEIRNLQWSEIGELSEGFDARRQVGSSTMAQKKNPIGCENVCGLARTLRGFMLPTWENALQWHERDLSNSSSERFVIPHTLILADDIITKMTRILKDLTVDTKAMGYNLKRTQGLIMAEPVMLALVDKGVMGRQEAHELLRTAALEAQKSGKHLKEVLWKRSAVSKRFSKHELERLFDPKNYLGDAEAVVLSTVKKARAYLGRSPK